MKDRSETLERGTLMALMDASAAIISELELSEVFQRIAERAAAVIDAEGASVILYDPDNHQLVFHSAVGPQAELLIGQKFSADLGIAGQTIKTRRAIRVDDVTKNRHFFAGIDALTHIHTSGLIAAPLIHSDQVLGVVEVINPKGRDRFTARDGELIQVFANLAAAATASAQAYDRVARDNRGLRESMPSAEVIGQSQVVRHVTELCRKVALSNATVLIYGETGTGKELASNAIHSFSARRDKPFIATNCAALPETLLESELFGHEKGAFTDARDRKLGRFELADGGTIFLDEIGELKPDTQVKLLRVLEEREFVRVGGTQTITCDVRIIAATNRDLTVEMDAGRFRADLYYRLNIFPITVPPLRERLEDLPLLIDHFGRQIAPALGVATPKVSDEAMSCLMGYHWPGNIRELRNVIERCTLLCSEGQIEVGDLPPEVVAASPHQQFDNGGGGGVALGGSRLADHERALILKALNECNWNQSAAARKLGISRDHLRYRVKKYDLTRPDR
ncbi:MAG: Fis family transcriptional regulator [Planctomycetaceae bacterium]|nr:Fis family transcriptional regulator [Planctomycetaceae bacterium]